MKADFTWKHGLVMVLCSAIFALVASQAVMGIGSLQLAKHSGHTHKSYPTFKPRVYVAASLAATAEDVSIYCPGIKEGDWLTACIEVDSAANALASTVLVNLTDSTYVVDDDTIAVSQAITVNSDLIIFWHQVD